MIAGAYTFTSNQATAPGSTVNGVNLLVDDGSSSVKGVSYNYGTSGQPDRALGSIATTASGDRAFQVGLHAFLRDRLPTARTAVEAGLRTSRQDCDLLFLAWRLACHDNDRRRARRLLRRLRRADLDEKWIWEIEHVSEVALGSG